jgi:Asp-tRNA(Asn)/Glu-tRNA(Gln) amidotransferase A subunit family amidase
MAEVNGARDKFADSYKPPLGANVYTYPADLSGTPTITLPVGFSSEGLPLSIQIAGQPLSEPTLCRIGHAYEEATGSYKKHPNV